jgi:glycosyltransferase involved in cell wall biosynthesis
MIKLCIISTIPITIKAFFGEQLKYLQENDYDITVITSSATSPQDFGKDFPESIKLHTVKMSRTISPLEDLRAFREISKLIKQGNFDIVQYVTPKAALLGSLASCFAKVPVRLYLMWGLYYVTQTGFKKFVFKTIEKIVCSCSTAIAPDSKGNVKLAVAEGLCKADKIAVVGHGSANGVDTERFDPVRLYEDGRKIRTELNIPETAKVFGCIAAIVGDKGVNELIEAFDIISKNYPQAYLLYIGQITEKDPVKKTTLETMKSNSRIIHLGWQTEPEKYMAAMDIFVLPTYREGFGVVNIEASAMKLPVISTDVPGPQESIVNGETGILVPARTIEPLLAAMRKLVEDPDLARRLGKSGRQRVKDYFEQKQLWNAILQHKMALLRKSGQFHELDGEPMHRIR